MLKIEDYILKYKEYPKQYQSRYQLGDFQSHPRSKDKTLAKNKTSIKIIFQVSLLQSLHPLLIKITSLYNTTSLSIQFSHKCYMQYYRSPIAIKEH